MEVLPGTPELAGVELALAGEVSRETVLRDALDGARLRPGRDRRPSNLGLLTVSVLFPEFARASAWHTEAMEQLERAARVQLTDDGGQVEGCPHYHNVCIHYFYRAQLVAASVGAGFSDVYEARVRQGLTYSLYGFRPSGTGVPWGDSDADLRAVTAALNGGLAFGHWDPLRLLVDLAGHSASNRLGVFAHQPAPVQVSYLGYPNTTGLGTIGYRLTDAVCDPPGEPARHTEELVRLPGCFCCYAPPEAAPAVAPLPALARGQVTFGSLHHLAKLNGPVLDLWCSVLDECQCRRKTA